MSSSFVKLSGETLQTCLKQSDLSWTKSSATQISELAEIKSCLEENTALVKETTSETKALSSKFDMYVGRDHFSQNTLMFSFRDYFRNLGIDILMFMQKIL